MAGWLRFSTTSTDEIGRQNTIASSRRNFVVAAAVFGLIPTAASVAWLAAVGIAALGVILTSSWKLRFIFLAYVIPELLRLPWPASCFAAVATFLIIQGEPWHALFERGQRRALIWEWVALALAGAICGAFVVWLDASRIRSGIVFALPLEFLPYLPVIAVISAVLNALGEELLWRGLLSRLAPKGISALGCLAGQTMSFGVAHFYGIPQGWLGMVAAGVFSGLVYTVARRYRLRGALVLHFCTDLVIFVAVTSHARLAWG